MRNWIFTLVRSLIANLNKYHLIFNTWFAVFIPYNRVAYKFQNPIWYSSGLNFQKPYLSGRLRHNSYPYADVKLDPSYSVGVYSDLYLHRYLLIYVRVVLHIFVCSKEEKKTIIFTILWFTRPVAAPRTCTAARWRFIKCVLLHCTYLRTRKLGRRRTSRLGVYRLCVRTRLGCTGFGRYL